MLRGVCVAVLLWLALALIPQIPVPIGTGIDASWMYGLNMAHARGLVAGTGIVYTMGPLGYLLYADPGLVPGWAALLVLVVAYALLWYGVLRCVRVAGLQTGAVAGFALGILSLYWLQYPDAWQAACLAALLAASLPGDSFPTLDLTIAGIGAGVTLLMKFNDGVTLLIVFYILLAGAWLRFRRLAPALALAGVPLVVFEAGMSANGGFSATLPYIRNTMEIVRGYSDAMSYDGPLWQTLLAAGSAVFIVFAVFLFRERPRAVAVGVAASAILAASAFKHGMVRQDGHADVTQSKLAVAALFVFVVGSRPLTRRAYGAFAVLSALTSVVVCHLDPVPFARRCTARATLEALVPSVRDLVSWNRAWEELGRRNGASLARLRLGPEFQQAIGTATVDAFPARIETIRANGWTYQPRPVIQSFVAYTPALDRLNADHIAGPDAAQFVVLQPGSIDNRNLFFDDPLSWRTLINHYDLKLAAPGAILLTRRMAGPRFGDPEPMGQTVAGWNQEIPVPHAGRGEAVMMKVDIRRTLVGELSLMLFRGGAVQLQTSRERTGQSFARMVPANLMSGLLVSPMPHDLTDLPAWFTSLDGCDPVVRIYWWTPTPYQFERQIRIDWYRLRPLLH